MTVEDKVKAVAAEEARHLQALTNDAVRSGAFLYPFKGIAYFLTHRSLLKPFWQKLAPSLGLGISITAAMFVLTYLPQAAVLAFVEGPVAPISAALLVLSESSTIFNLLSRNFIIGDSLIDTFDGTLVSRDCESLVTQGREVKRGGDAIGRLGKLVKKPFARFTPSAIVRYLMYLPLNFIPVVGTAIFITLQGKRFGPNAHARFFQLKGLNKTQQEQWVEQRRGAYTSFGIAASLLELVPVVSVFFSFTNACGAALWAADLEKKLGTTAPGLRSKADKAS